MDANQLGRRNLSPDAFKVLLGRRYNRMKKAAHRPEKRPQSEAVNPERTREKLAKEHGVSKATVERAGKFAEEVEKTPELKAAIETGKPVLQAKRELKEKKREARCEENRAKIAAVPEPEKVVAKAEAKFAAIVIDPPWDWGDEGDQDQLGRAQPEEA